MRHSTACLATSSAGTGTSGATLATRPGRHPEIVNVFLVVGFGLIVVLRFLLIVSWLRFLFSLPSSLRRPIILVHRVGLRFFLLIIGVVLIAFALSFPTFLSFFSTLVFAFTLLFSLLSFATYIPFPSYVIVSHLICIFMFIFPFAFRLAFFAFRRMATFLASILLSVAVVVFFSTTATADVV